MGAHKPPYSQPQPRAFVAKEIPIEIDKPKPYPNGGKEDFVVPISIEDNSMYLRQAGGDGECLVGDRLIKYDISSTCGLGGLHLIVGMQVKGEFKWTNYVIDGRDLLQILMPHFLEHSSG
jgi:hypothetical protein